jgi:septal ring factor EnvC (AmiA/AmiB activator)
MSSFFGIDTYIAFGLIGILIVVFLIYNMGLLPKKGIPYIVGALLALFGIHVFREWRSKNLRRTIAELEKQIKEKEKELKESKEKYSASERDLQIVLAELERQLAAAEKTILKIREENKKEKERIDGLDGEELHDEFRKAFGSS